MELRNQQRTIKESGVAVKLYKPRKMSCLSLKDEKQLHTKGHRIWMSSEYKILNPQELKKLKILWEMKN